MRMCWPTRTFMSGNTYVRAGRYIRTYKSRLNFIRDRKEFSSKQTSVFFEQDWTIRDKKEFSSERTSVFFEQDWSFLRNGLEFSSNRTGITPELKFFIQYKRKESMSKRAKQPNDTLSFFLILSFRTSESDQTGLFQ